MNLGCLERKKKGWRYRKGLKRGYRVFCRDRVWSGQEFSVTMECFMSRRNVLCHDRVGNGGETLCPDRIFYVVIECGQIERFCVATEQFYVAT